MNVLGAEAVAVALYGALDGHHAVDVAGCLDDASVLHVAGRSGLAGDYQGRDAILGLLARMADLTEGTLSYGTPRASAAGGGFVLAGEVRAVRGRRTLDTWVEVRIDASAGLLREAWLWHEDQAAFDRFWS